MAELLLVCEDVAQEEFVVPLIMRFAAAEGVAVNVRIRSARGGFAQVLRELEALGRACAEGRETIPDGVVAVVDANCKGFVERRNAVVDRCGHLGDRLVAAIPDPHVERWYLLDSHAFKIVLGEGCRAPDAKCEKGRYKQLLSQAVLDCGVEPLFGGIEYAGALSAAMDLVKTALQDASFGRFAGDLRAWLKRSRHLS